jgi:hypothetical protein
LDHQKGERRLAVGAAWHADPNAGWGTFVPDRGNGFPTFQLKQ